MNEQSTGTIRDTVARISRKRTQDVRQANQRWEAGSVTKAVTTDKRREDQLTTTQ
jgi:hypothetical protein